MSSGPDDLVRVDHFSPGNDELCGEIVLDVSVLDGHDYDLDDLGDGRIVAQFWEADSP